MEGNISFSHYTPPASFISGQCHRIDPPFFIQGIAETLNHSLELISESVAILPSDCLLQLQKPNKNGSLIVTLRYPANTTVPIHVVCRPPSQEAVGFFGYPGPTPNPTPSPQKSQSPLKRKRSSNLRRAAAVIINNEDSMAPAPIERRRSQVVLTDTCSRPL